MTITRKQYMTDSSALHYNYYLQFCTRETIQAVTNRFGLQQLEKALKTDQHLNNIDLREWDALCFTETKSGSFRAILPINRYMITAVNETITRAVLVCIAKNAAIAAIRNDGVHLAA